DEVVERVARVVGQIEAATLEDADAARIRRDTDVGRVVAVVVEDVVRARPAGAPGVGAGEPAERRAAGAALFARLGDLPARLVDGAGELVRAGAPVRLAERAVVRLLLLELGARLALAAPFALDLRQLFAQDRILFVLPARVLFAVGGRRRRAPVPQLAQLGDE